MPAFSGVDYLDFDSLLTDEEKLARQTARQFVDEQILPIIEECNREGKFPRQLVPQLGDPRTGRVEALGRADMEPLAVMDDGAQPSGILGAIV